MKNLLLFVPAIVAHAYDASSLLGLCAAFVAFGCAASANYLINDLLDRADDRISRNKDRRALAAGRMDARLAVGLAALLVGVAAITAAFLPVIFQLALTGYLALSMAYSFILKRIAVVDILSLATLHDLRLVGGAGAAMIPVSAPLIVLGGCLFATLALIKRVEQLSSASAASGALPGRSYTTCHLKALKPAALGGSALTVILSALFFDELSAKFSRPAFLWLIVLLLAIWLSRCSFLAGRGRMEEDMVAFVLGDRLNLLALLVLALSLVAAG
jgi:4-hydroxybenzoate polyprenyltransferase